MADRFALRRQRGIGRRFQIGQDTFAARGMILHPRGEPSSDVAPTRDRREIIEFLKHAGARQRLNHTEPEARAPNPAAGQAERGAFGFQFVNARVYGTQARLLLRFRTRLRARWPDVASEFFLKNVRERFRRFGLMWPTEHG